MVTVAAVVAWTGDPNGAGALGSIGGLQRVSDVALVVPEGHSGPRGDHTTIVADTIWSAEVTVKALRWFEETKADHVLWLLSPLPDMPAVGLNRLIDCAADSKAAVVYSDYYDLDADRTARLHPLIDYQPGSIRDDFDFGKALLLSRKALAGIASAMEEEGVCSVFGGWYDLRLRLTERGPVVHLPEPTYSLRAETRRSDSESHFAYVDPRNRDYQIEMERVVTAHLKRIGAFVNPPNEPLAKSDASFPVVASIVIPVKNRVRTIADAVQSALAQKTPFDFNVIVVDNHSDDGTTQALADIAGREPRLVHLHPRRTDLGIGGCWNEAIYSSHCGRYAVQLDSDDLYSDTDVLARIVEEFERTGCAMVIGSYTIVDFKLNPIPPGLIDHREWTDENGHNNALRINGLGAPRAFHVPTLRKIGFPNVSYGEDYAVALQLTRRYRIGRIYDSLYSCRRWEDNTDHALTLEKSNRYAVYKDRLRTVEIAARQR